MLSHIPCSVVSHKMMITEQKICTHGAFSVPRPGISRNVWSLSRTQDWKLLGSPQNGRRTVAAAQGSSLFVSSDGAISGEAVHEKVAGVIKRKLTNSTKLDDLTSPARSAAITTQLQDRLPPLLSMIIDGLPPLQQSQYIQEAHESLRQFAKRHHNIISFDSYCRVGLSYASYMYSGVISPERLTAIAINYSTGFLLDDLLFDTPDEFLQDQYGIPLTARESPAKIQEYLDHLDAVFISPEPPHSPASAIETLMWESGRELLRLSNPEWFHAFAAALAEHHRFNVESEADIENGNETSFQDLESYAVMRAGNMGGKFIQLIVEFAKNTYIPKEMRTDPYLQKLTTATSVHLGFVNDIYSYHKESSLEGNPRNVITVLMQCDGTPFVQTVHSAIDLVNMYAQAIVNSESEASNPRLRSHLQDVKTLIAGNVYFGCMDKRYRHSDSVFPEQREAINV